MNVERFKEQLLLHESIRLMPYRDTVGKLTIGVGRNLTDVGISQDEAHYMLTHDIVKVSSQLDSHLPWWRELSEVRQRVVADMCFNLGIGGLLKFVNTLAAVKSGDYTAAASGMRASKWYSQVGVRGRRLVKMMETDVDVF
jgi:lysozyme